MKLSLDGNSDIPVARPGKNSPVKELYHMSGGSDVCGFVVTKFDAANGFQTG